VEAHFPGFVIYPENTSEFSLVRYHRAVKDAVGARNQIPRDNRVLSIAPQDILCTLQAGLARER